MHLSSINKEFLFFNETNFSTIVYNNVIEIILKALARLRTQSVIEFFEKVKL